MERLQSERQAQRPEDHENQQPDMRLTQIIQISESYPLQNSSFNFYLAYANYDIWCCRIE